MKAAFYCLLIVLPICTEGCEVGWLQLGQKCYTFSHMTAAWYDAESICNGFHSKLAEPMTIEENKFLQSHSASLNGDFWIGISDIIEEGTWIYSSNRQPVQLTYWTPGDPNNQLYGNCVALWNYGSSDGRWADEPCDRKHYFVCELPNSNGGSQEIIG